MRGKVFGGKGQHFQNSSMVVVAHYFSIVVAGDEVVVVDDDYRRLDQEEGVEDDREEEDVDTTPSVTNQETRMTQDREGTFHEEGKRADPENFETDLENLEIDPECPDIQEMDLVVGLAENNHGNYVVPHYSYQTMVGYHYPLGQSHQSMLVVVYFDVYFDQMKVRDLPQ